MYDDDLKPVMVYSPTEAGWKRAKDFDSVVVGLYMDGRLSTNVMWHYTFISTIVTGVSVSRGMTKLSGSGNADIQPFSAILSTANCTRSR